MSATSGDDRTFAQVREHYEIEKELADRLRRASKADRARLYNELYDELFRRIPDHPGWSRVKDPSYRAAAVAEQFELVRHFLRPEHTVLEVGPGDCALSVRVAEMVQRVYAVDVASELVARLALPKNVEFVLSDGCSVPVPPGSVDVAYSNQLMEHLHPEDAEEQVRGIQRALVPGGVYVCITPNRLSGPHDVSKHFDAVATGFHLKEYSMGELVRLFRDAGFRKVRRFLYSGKSMVVLPIPPSPWVESAVDRLPSKWRRRVALSLPVRFLIGGDNKLIAIK